MSRIRHAWWYGPAFAIINWLEATAMLLTLGKYSPTWVMRFASWHACRQISRAKDRNRRRLQPPF